MKTTIVRLRLVFIWRFIFYERRRLLQSQKILAPFILKKISRTRHMTLSVFMCVRRREADENQNYIYPKLMNIPIVEIYIYTSQDRYVVHFFLHFLYCHIIVILFFSNGIKTCLYMYKSIQIHVCRTFLFTLSVLSTYL